MGNILKGGGLNDEGTKSYIDKNECLDLNKFIIKKGDLLMAMTDMKNNVALLGHTALMDRDNIYIQNQRVGLIRPNDNKIIDYPYLYILSNSFDFINDIRSRANSGVQVNLSTKGIKETLITLPNKAVHSSFHNITFPLIEKIFILKQENNKHKNIRDTLLPKLLSGEIELPDDLEVTDDVPIS